MGTKNKIFLGLPFPANFPLNETACSQLAEILLLNPRISVSSAKDIISNHDLWAKINLLIEKLSCRLQNISLINVDNIAGELSSIQLELLYELFHLAHPKEDFDFVIFKKKLLTWVIEFSFPLPEELIIIACALKVSEDKIFEIMYMMLFLKEMPSYKIIEYLKKYHQDIAPFQLEELLDLYSFKMKSTEKNSSMQLSIFPDQFLTTLNSIKK